MSKPIIQIDDVSNGWSYRRLPYDETDTTQDEVAFAYDDNNEKSEYETLKELLWEIISELKPYSKHNKFNVVVNIEEDGEIEK